METVSSFCYSAYYGMRFQFCQYRIEEIAIITDIYLFIYILVWFV